MHDKNSEHLCISWGGTRACGGDKGQGIGMYLLVLVSTEEFLVTYCGEHFSEDLACEDGVFGVGYFADFLFFGFAGETFCLGMSRVLEQNTDGHGDREHGRERG